MKEQKKNRTKWIHLRLTDREFDLIQNRFKKSTCPKLSDFARKNLLQEPVVLKYRNESLDEFMLELIRLRRELNALAGNFNQTVKKLHTLRQIPEFRDCIMQSEAQRQALLEKVEEIQKAIDRTAAKWLQ